MSKLDFNDIQEKFKAALTEKESNKEIVLKAIKENELEDKLNSIQKDKDKINSLEDLDIYQKILKNFFNEVYEIITAPGVNKFVEWLESLDNRGIDSNTRKNIARILIDNYSDYDSQIKTILENSVVINNTGSLFEEIKKSIRTNIIKRIADLGTKKDEIKTELPDFIEDLDNMLDEISKIKELSYNNVKDFYTDNIDNRNDDDYNPEIDEESDFYFELIKKVVEKKDFLTTDKDKISLSIITENVQSSIDDIKNSIKTIKTIGVSTDSEDDIKIFYNKFEKSFQFNNVDNISDYIQDSINDTWDKIINAYNLCQDFYSNFTQEKVNKLKSNKSKWSVPEFKFAGKIEQYILTLNNIISDNPVNSIKTTDISKIKSVYTKVEKSIKSLEENNPKDDIVTYFSNITSDFKHKKIEILNRLRIEQSEIEKLNQAVNEINTFIENIKNSNNLLDSLNEDFVDGIIESYNYITDEYRKAIENSDIKDDLDFLDKINEDGYVLSKEELEKKVEVLKHLLEYDLININLTKNI